MKAPSGELWVHEVKHDGYRLMARKVDGRVRL
jgi:ATP-dependent DNA ligase